MAAKIPQDVTREDRLFGPLTLRQFLYVLFAAGIIFLIYQYYSIGYLYFYEFIALSLFIGGLAAMLAFGRVNGRPFPIFLVNLKHFISVPKRWGWQKEDRATNMPIKIQASDLKTTQAEAQERQSGKVVTMQIEQLATVLDTGGTMNAVNDETVISQTSTITPAASKLNFEPSDVEDVLTDTD